MATKKRMLDWDAGDAAGFVKRWEGCRLEAYKCPAGVWTIGYGHTADVTPGKKISQREAETMLLGDLEYFQNQVSGRVKVPLSRGQFIALMSFVYNVGAYRFERSTLLKTLNEGDYRGAADQLPKWCYSNGVRLEGLKRRREAERELFLEDEE